MFFSKTKLRMKKLRSTFAVRFSFCPYKSNVHLKRFARFRDKSLGMIWKVNKTAQRISYSCARGFYSVGDMGAHFLDVKANACGCRRDFYAEGERTKAYTCILNIAPCAALGRSIMQHNRGTYGSFARVRM